MAEIAIDMTQALQLARAFNLAFNNAFMYGGTHQTTRENAGTFFNVLLPLLYNTAIITISAEKDSVYVENHCVDKLVSVQRINSRFKKTGLQSISFDRDVSLPSVQALFYLLGALADFTSVETMQAYLDAERITGVKINYVVYKKVTLDDTIVNKDALSDSQLLFANQHIPGTGSQGQADSANLLREFSEILSLHTAQEHGGSTPVATGTANVSQADYDSFISKQIKSINTQLNTTENAGEGTTLTPAEMLETVYKLKENVLENIKLQRATGKLAATEELAISEINRISYQVIVRLIKEEYRNDRQISVKRLAQIIRRMLPDIKELKYLLPQLKDGLFAEGMSPSDYLSLVKELSKELDSDGLMQVMAEASDQIGLTLTELIDGIKEAPEEAAKLIVLAAELKKGGVASDDQQMSAVLSDYIEKVSRALALQSPEAATPAGGLMLRSAVTRIEREILDRLKTQNVGLNTVSEVAQKLTNQFAETISSLKGDWVKSNISKTKNDSEDTLLSIIEQIAEQGEEGAGVTHEIRTILLANGHSAETIDAVVTKARQRALAVPTRTVEIPQGVFNASNTNFFLDREVKQNVRYNTPFTTVLISFEKVVDLRTYKTFEITPDVHVQLVSQSLKLLKNMQRDLDIVGIITVHNKSIPLLLLPMTEYTGALFVKRRIEKDFPRHEFVVDDITVHIEPEVTISDFNKRVTPDKASYLKAMYKLYCQPKLQ
jgi:hypothetical protein